jgi:hypothetical protein
MTCKACTSANSLEYSAEINVHFGGWEGLRKPSVLVFPKLLVCGDCGFTEFAIPGRELAALAGVYGKVKPNERRRGREMEQPMAKTALEFSTLITERMDGDAGQRRSDTVQSSSLAIKPRLTNRRPKHRF